MNKEDFFKSLYLVHRERVLLRLYALKNNGYYYLKTWISFNLHVCDGKKLKQKTKKQSWMNHCCPIYNINLQKSIHMDICAVTILDG